MRGKRGHLRALGEIAVCVVAGLAAFAPVPSSADTLEACKKKIEADPRDGEGYRCVYQHARTAAAYDEALAVLGEWAAVDEAGWATLTLANAQSDQDLAPTPDTYARAIELFGASDEQRGLAFAYLGLSTWYGYKADFKRVDEALVGAEAAARAIGDASLRATVKIQQARQLLKRDGNMDEVVRLAREVESEVFPDGPYQTRVLVLHVLSSAFAELERPEDEVRTLRQFIELTQSKGDVYVEATARMKLLEAGVQRPELVASGLVPDPKVSVAEIEQLAHRAGNKTVETSARCKRATWELSVEGLEACLGMAEAIDDRSSKKEAHERLALLLAESDLEGALEHARAGLALAEEVEAGIPQHLVAALVQARHGDAMEAFERFVVAAEGRLSSDMNAFTLAELQAVSRYGLHAAVEHAWSRGHKHKALAWLDRALARATLQRMVAPSDAVAQPLSAAELTELQASLRADHALAVFALPPPPPGELYPSLTPRVFILTRDDIRGLDLSVEPELDTRASLFRDRVSEGSVDETVATRLGGELVAAAVEALPAPVGDVTIVPDDPLHGFPFELLEVGDGLLGDRLSTSEAPSLSVLSRARQRPTRGTGVVVLADPVSPAADELPPLPAARREAERLATRFDPAAHIRVGPDATEEALRSSLQTPPQLLHLAAHGIEDDVTSGRAMVVLTASGGHDGRLRLDELSTLQLGGAVVVLATCEGATGRHIPGEGPTSLAHGLLAAGARAVVTTRWPIHDTEAEQLYEAFYERAGEGLTVGQAVQQAQRDRRRAGASAREWAGLVVFGDAKAELPKQSRGWMTRARGLALAIPVLLLGGWAFYRRRTSKVSDR